MSPSTVHSINRTRHEEPAFDFKAALTHGTPFYAYLGFTDLAVEKVREAGARASENADKTRQEFADLPAKAKDAVEKLRVRIEDAPEAMLDALREAGENIADTYEELATRGEKLIDRIRNQQSTQDLLHQVDNTRAHAKGAATSARKSFHAVEESAVNAFETATHEARRAAEKFADSFSEEAKIAGDEVRESVQRTRTAAKRTATTTRKRAQTTSSRAKATATSARKSAAKASKAAKDAAAKVGD